MADKLTCDEWIKTWIMENNCLGLSSVDMNSKYIYKASQLRKGYDWIKLYNNILDEKITYLIKVIQ